MDGVGKQGAKEEEGAEKEGAGDVAGKPAAEENVAGKGVAEEDVTGKGVAEEDVVEKGGGSEVGGGVKGEVGKKSDKNVSEGTTDRRKSASPEAADVKKTFTRNVRDVYY